MRTPGVDENRRGYAAMGANCSLTSSADAASSATHKALVIVR